MLTGCPLYYSFEVALEEKRREVIKEWIKSGRVEA